MNETTSIAQAITTIGTCSDPEHDLYDNEESCVLCDRKIEPSCSAIRIATGHMESPEGERGFNICLDCAQGHPGFLEAIVMLTADVTDKWESEMRPIREFRAARRESEEAFRQATVLHREVLAAEIEEHARQYRFETGRDLPDWETRLH